MNIDIIYRDQFERSGKLLIEMLTEQYGYQYISFAQIVKRHIENNSDLGVIANEHIKKGEYIPDEIFHSIVTSEIRNIDSTKLLIQAYPKTKSQNELFQGFCKLNNIVLKKIWYMYALNTESNFSVDKNLQLINEKYKSSEYIIMNSNRTKKSNLEAIENFENKLNVIQFNCEAFGLNQVIENEKLKAIILKSESVDRLL